jgi:hypothetical protein
MRPQLSIWGMWTIREGLNPSLSQAHTPTSWLSLGTVTGLRNTTMPTPTRGSSGYALLRPLVLGALLVLGSLAAVPALDAVALAAVRLCDRLPEQEVAGCKHNARITLWLTHGVTRMLGLAHTAARTALIMFMFSCSMLAYANGMRSPRNITCFNFACLLWTRSVTVPQMD